MENLIKFGMVTIQKSKLLEEKLLIGIDSGSTLTKIIFLHKNEFEQLYDKNNSRINLHHGLCKNDDFEVVIKWIKKYAYIPQGTNYLVHMTGIKCLKRIEIVEAILGLNIYFVNQEMSLITGLRITLEKIGIENVIAPEVYFENIGKPENSITDKFHNDLQKRFNKDVASTSSNPSLIYPCLFQICGSVSKFIYFNNEGKGELIKCQLISKNIILGLGKCLLDTNDYKEIVELAENGNRANVDTQTKDILSDVKDSPYGIFPLEMPLFPFGKCMDLNTGLEDYAREDVAASIVAFYCILIIMEYFHMGKRKMITKIYLTGNIFQSDIFQKEIRRFLVLLPKLFEMEMINFPSTSALGAMLCSQEK